MARTRFVGDAGLTVRMTTVMLLLGGLFVALVVTLMAIAGGYGGMGFAVLVGINSTGWVPHAVQSIGGDASRWFLVTAIAGIGMKTQLKELATVGIKPVALMIGETAFLVVLSLGLMRWLA